MRPGVGADSSVQPGLERLGDLGEVAVPAKPFDPIPEDLGAVGLG
jgi:hypothetical protein